MTRQKAPLFGRTRMVGDAEASYICLPGVPLFVEVVGKAWVIRPKQGGAPIAVGTSTGPQSAANAARNAILKWAEKVRAM